MSTAENLSTRTDAVISDSATAVAYPNMALVKYWGKRDEALILPVNSSLSMTLNIFPTTTRVTVIPRSHRDAIILNGREADHVTRQRIVRFLDLVRRLADRHERVAVDTTNTVPTGAGLASSASGFAALAAAASTAFGLRLDQRALSRLARRGSGSACRSIFGGFVIWHGGKGFGPRADEGCFAEPIAAERDWALVIALVDSEPKKISSRAAMRHTLTTSPLYLPWAAAATADLAHMRVAIEQDDLVAAGRIAEHNALGMHAALLAARPAIRYLSPRSLQVLDRVEQVRAAGTPAYATIDAGANVAVLCARTDVPRVAAALQELPDVFTHVALPGPAAAIRRSDS
ncbi:diphosphomevalonate decarboxylase [Nocardia goodfellowii]|uniref:diphosphomevalonate decarboxylase n=1 Tax=Nocardia goodfellowii TaxID=882446 RepID=A0ABS4QIN6_9NOCA|nr:diphosphomevalonate decarboxylase [Nocardia goodfellowii]MBP2191556.1 diphosphomevalonate decarboxylase [Nocardia goodfellowii]